MSDPLLSQGLHSKSMVNSVASVTVGASGRAGGPLAVRRGWLVWLQSLQPTMLWARTRNKYALLHWASFNVPQFVNKNALMHLHVPALLPTESAAW